MKGRPRKPTNVLEFSGALDKNPQRRRARAGEPKPDKPLGACPRSQNDRVRAAWNFIKRSAPAGVLTKADRTGVLAAAICLAEFELNGSLDHIKEYRQWASRFGLTPADRSRVSIPDPPKEPDPDDPFE